MRSSIRSERQGRLPYRKDVEGLRAVAVLPVLGYHINLSILPGGFVGVDVFFVISGYLITRLLFADIESDKFSIIRFYERRVRRILPALLATLLATFLLGLRYCLPDELVDLSKSLVASALSASNFYFWSTTGYFDGPAGAKPLLHMWSLAVEEQFYIVWPLFLAAGRRYLGSRLLPAALVVAVSSFALSAVGAFEFPSTTFYLPFTRIWELAAGGILALRPMPAIRSGAKRDALAATGIALILCSVFLINSTMPFPGLLAAPPCLGAVLVIVAGHDGQSLVGRALSLRPVTFLGAISYSLYLWHWPITVFQNSDAFLVAGVSPGVGKLAIVVASLVVAVLSWRFIEQPFRTAGARKASAVLIRAAAATGVLVALGSAAWAGGGLPSRFSERELTTLAELRGEFLDSWRRDRCFLYDRRTDWTFAPECLAIASGKRNYLLLGDSHAAQLWFGLSSEFRNVNFLQATAAYCLPTVVHAASESAKCNAVMDGVLHGFLARTRVDRVLLCAAWKPAAMHNLAVTLEWMRERHINVTLIGPTVIFDSPVPRLVMKAIRASDPSLIQRHISDSMETLDERMSRLAAAHGAEYVSLRSLQCKGRVCFDQNGHWPEMFDRSI